MAQLDTLLKADAAAQARRGSAAAYDSSAAAGESAGAIARTLEAAWHGAEALHFFMLAQRQLYAGDVAAALVTAQRLSLYEDILGPKDVYSLVALTSYYGQAYGTCSRSFIKLEALGTDISSTPGASADGFSSTFAANDSATLSSLGQSTLVQEREAYGDLALSIFVRAKPMDPPESAANSFRCPTAGCSAVLRTWAVNCMACGTNFPACVATGQPIFGHDYWRCRTCKHRALKQHMRDRVSCPLCHAPVPQSTMGAPAVPAAAQYGGMADTVAFGDDGEVHAPVEQPVSNEPFEL